MSEEAGTAGWDAIDTALQKIYGDQEPKHYGTMISYMLGGPDPLDGISVYEVNDPVPHWHFVTYGFSELYDKESDNAEYSGYGFELTLRLSRPAGEEEPPGWALNLLQNMGRYVFNSGNIFNSGDYLDANGPICLGSPTKLTALAFTDDPFLPQIDTPNGKVEFLQMVGITGDELEAMQIWNTSGVLAACKAQMPLYITDLMRDSVLEQESVAESVRLGSESEGSSTGFLAVDQLAAERIKKGFFKGSADEITLGAKQAGIIGKLITGRITKGRSLSLVGKGVQVIFDPADQPGFEREESGIRIKLNDAAVTELARHLKPVAGTFELSAIKGLSFQIIPTQIRDQEGNVVETIG
ncbi:branched-chain alpha-keto acid dehydrogenase subunit E2 [Paenibacillus sp. CAA11]|uniref:suppressor of fused domain protein n=1 Tax=Paenibacillus sp. CAA11 TaxID=1532905 RepID=UPI000D34E6AB|nr:suppressor of fused domain protein [Paenibacillus sp. CAA11]AWB43737.1 branched-chain alpha-keto acid dehydrogenase subunit E2 [Paenibacillus sp. CAA11]